MGNTTQSATAFDARPFPWACSSEYELRAAKSGIQKPHDTPDTRLRVFFLALPAFRHSSEHGDVIMPATSPMSMPVHSKLRRSFQL
jgi:hypothetical protein